MSYQEQCARARKLYLEGQSQQAIARALGVSENTVTAWKAKDDWPEAPLSPEREAQQKKAFALFRAGQSQQAIAAQFGVSENTVGSWKKKYGWIARQALLQDKALGDALTQVAGVVQAELARRAASGAYGSAAALQRALACVCGQLERPDLALPGTP